MYLPVYAESATVDQRVVFPDRKLELEGRPLRYEVRSRTVGRNGIERDGGCGGRFGRRSFVYRAGDRGDGVGVRHCGLPAFRVEGSDAQMQVHFFDGRVAAGQLCSENIGFFHARSCFLRQKYDKIADRKKFAGRFDMLVVLNVNNVIISNIYLCKINMFILFL